MRRRAWAFALLSTLSLPVHALDADQVFERVSPSVFQVLAYRGEDLGASQGSGVVIGPEQMVTNCHVLEKAKTIHVKHGNVLMRAFLEFPDAERDLCVLRVEDLKVAAPPIRPLSGIGVGLRVYAIGAPRSMELTLTDGLISAIRNHGGYKQLQTSAAIARGSSGGGLFDAQGHLVGITTSTLGEGLGLNFAVPADYIREVPERGKAALAKLRSVEAASGAGGSPSQGGESPASKEGRRINGAELSRQFAPGLEVTAQQDKDRSFTLRVRTGGRLQRICILCKTEWAEGRYRVDTENNTVCMDWPWVSYPYSTCFGLYETGQDTYASRSLDSRTTIEYRNNTSSARK